MAQVIDMSAWRLAKAQTQKQQQAPQLSDFPPLECPRCEALCPPAEHTADGSTVYRCVGHGHRLTWRIAADGAMLHGARGNRHYF